MGLHLDEIAKAVAPGSHALLIVDGAGWHGELRPVFRTVCLLTLRGHFPSHIFESLFWRFVADA